MSEALLFGEPPIKKRGYQKRFACSVAKNVIKDVHWRTLDGKVWEKTENFGSV